MIFVKLMGGLGNQMFQLAAGLALARHQTEVRVDLDFLLDRTPGQDFVFRDYDLGLFAGEPRVARRAELPLHWRFYRQRPLRAAARALQRLDPRYLADWTPRYNPRLLAAPDGTYLEGFWQSERYFAGIAGELRRAFTFKAPVAEASRPLLDRIRAANAVCVNVRRGDFVGSAFHGVVGAPYLEAGARHVAERCAAPTFFVFSDDLAWCREHVQLGHPTEFVGHEHKGDKFGAYLQLMIACRHFIIPNSSFGWWAAWLGAAADKLVVAPRLWYAAEPDGTPDVAPAGWTRL